MNVSKKLWLMIALAIIAVLVMMAVGLISKRNSMIEDRQNATRYVVETAWGVVAGLDKRRKQEKYPGRKLNVLPSRN